MNGVTAMLVVLGLSGAARAPDLEVEAATATGASQPELAEAVARALVAGGARVVLKAPASGACQYCAKVAVIDQGQGLCRIEVSQDRHRASAGLRLPPTSPLLDRARAIAIQARLLVTWETNPEVRAKEPAHALAHKPEPAAVAPRSPAPTVAAGSDAVATAPLARATAPVRVPEPVRASVDAVPTERASSVSSTAASPAAPAAPPRPVARADVDAPPSTEPKPSVPERTERRARPTSERPAREPSSTSAPIDLGTTATKPDKPAWPWIPTVIGGGAAIAAVVCAGVARDRYDALSDRNQSYTSAQAAKTEGENWQLASFILAGTAVVGLGTGVWGFVTRAPVTPVAVPMPGGGMVGVSGELP